MPNEDTPLFIDWSHPYPNDEGAGIRMTGELTIGMAKSLVVYLLEALLVDSKRTEATTTERDHMIDGIRFPIGTCKDCGTTLIIHEPRERIKKILLSEDSLSKAQIEAFLNDYCTTCWETIRSEQAGETEVESVTSSAGYTIVESSTDTEVESGLAQSDDGSDVIQPASGNVSKPKRKAPSILK
jgi:hypothetical protein